jgi:cold shock protein
MARGTVKWFNAEKGYGFIARDGEPDLFVHHTNIAMDGFRHLRLGSVVEFEVGPGPKGSDEAKRVHVLDAPVGSR